MVADPLVKKTLRRDAPRTAVNGGKADDLRALIGEWRGTAALFAAPQWRDFQEHGRPFSGMVDTLGDHRRATVAARGGILAALALKGEFPASRRWKWRGRSARPIIQRTANSRSGRKGVGAAARRRAAGRSLRRGLSTRWRSPRRASAAPTCRWSSADGGTATFRDEMSGESAPKLG
jgi:hypothetical protein